MEELEAELEGIQYEFPAPSEEIKPVEEPVGPLTASVTTKTMFGEPEVVDNTRAEYHVDSVPAVLPEHSGEVLKITPQEPVQKMDEPVKAAPGPKKRKTGDKNATS